MPADNEADSDHDTDKPSLRDTVNDFGGAELKDAIHEQYGELMVNEVLFGEPLQDVKEIKTAVRSYDYGDASDRRVRESGIRLRFDPSKIDLAALKENGELREELATLAEEYLEVDVETFDLVVDDDYYEFWIVVDASLLE